MKRIKKVGELSLDGFPAIAFIVKNEFRQDVGFIGRKDFLSKDVRIHCINDIQKGNGFSDFESYYTEITAVEKLVEMNAKVYQFKNSESMFKWIAKQL